MVRIAFRTGSMFLIFSFLSACRESPEKEDSDAYANTLRESMQTLDERAEYGFARPESVVEVESHC